MEIPGFKLFFVFHSGMFYFPESKLTMEYSDSDDNEEFWCVVYRIGPHEGEWMVYYGERILGYSYIRFTHSREVAFEIAKNWIEHHEIP